MAFQGAKPRFARLDPERDEAVRIVAANSDGIGRAGRLAAKTARPYNGNVLAMPTAAVSLRKSPDVAYSHPFILRANI
ncbi:hypothetical protein MJ560_05120 [Klebsiella pneumoniae]|nr:hypothetical protein MJ560_05120 [Klebsiella pneumoniae]